MNHLFPPPILNSVLPFICILIAVPASQGDGDVHEQFMSCNSSHPCGKLRDIRYPFWGNGISPPYCGREGFELQCHDHEEYPTIQIGGQSFRVLEIDDTHHIMRIARVVVLDRDCPVFFPETRINHPLFIYTEKVQNLSLFYDCDGDVSAGKNNFSCRSEPDFVESFYTIDNYDQLRNLSNLCNRVLKFPVQLTPTNIKNLKEGKLREALNEWFEVTYYFADNKLCSECNSSQGICGSNQPSDEFSCLCRDQPHSATCPSGSVTFTGHSSKNLKLKLGIGMAGAISAFILVTCIFSFKKIFSTLSKGGSIQMTKSEQDLEAFITTYGPLALKRYDFSNIKKITNSFVDKLGQGGYGGVYKGKLSDGRPVAVKLLNASKGNGQEFINEVASISRTSHVNVVTLLGFCLEGNKRALIYEFMPNGSLEKFIHNGDTSNPSRQHLGWDRMYEIVIGIAKGLEYLHRGCNTRILHFDIKPHNILLDKDFVPKISDFGLAKLCLNKESVVSMLEARGTIGYIAPEVFSRNFGEVSHKSDVYSYGMMILELVGCKNNLNTGADRSSEIYFPHWIYKHFERDNEFKLRGIATSEENEIAKKMIVVGLWCIQTRPSDRPSMNRVIEMLQSSTDALKIPPKPFAASSPPRPPLDSSTISTS